MDDWRQNCYRCQEEEVECYHVPNHTDPIHYHHVTIITNLNFPITHLPINKRAISHTYSDMAVCRSIASRQRYVTMQYNLVDNHSSIRSNVVRDEHGPCTRRLLRVRSDVPMVDDRLLVRSGRQELWL